MTTTPAARPAATAAQAAPGNGGPVRRSAGLPWRLPLGVLVTLPFLVPIAWLVLSALTPVRQLYQSPPVVVPSPATLDNLSQVWRLLDVPLLAANSLLIAAITVVGTVLSTSLVGYALAVLPARGAGVLFALLLVTIMVPPTATIVPQFLLFRDLGWVGTWLPLIVPNIFGSAFYVFLFRQWFRGLPPHLFESAELDGANPLQAYARVALPLAVPAIAVVAVFAFLGSWNDFLAPLVYLRTPDSFTLTLGLATFQGIYGNQVQHVVAGALIALVPPVLVFALAHRFIVRGVATSGWRA